MPLVLAKAQGYAALVRDCFLTKPLRVRGAGGGILLGISNRGERSRDHEDERESDGAQCAHDVALRVRVGATTIQVGIRSLKRFPHKGDEGFGGPRALEQSSL